MCSGRAKLVGPQRPSAREVPWLQAPPCSGQPHDPEDFGPPTDVRGAVAGVPELFLDWPAERSLALHPTAVVWRASGPRGAEDLLSQTHCMRLYRE